MADETETRIGGMARQMGKHRLNEQMVARAFREKVAEVFSSTNKTRELSGDTPLFTL